MKSKIALFLELTVALLFVSLLSGCFGDGGVAIYDGTWTVGFVDSAFVPPTPASGATVTCSVQTPLPTVTLVNGVGSTTQTDTCTDTTTGPQQFIYLISVAIENSTGAVNAIVNGSPLTGQCISSIGCSAQAGTGSLSLTR